MVKVKVKQLKHGQGYNAVMVKAVFIDFSMTSSMMGRNIIIERLPITH